MKQNALVRILVWTFVMVLLIAALVMGVGGFSFASIGSTINTGFTTSFQYDDPSSYTEGDASVPASQIRQLDISWVAGGVDIDVYDGNEIIFTESASRQLESHEVLRYRVKGDKLTIQYCESTRLSFNNMPEKRLTVRIPASIALQSLGIENVSADVTVDGGGLSIRQVDIETVNGQVSVDNVVGKELQIETVNGSVTIHGAFSEVDAEGVNGRQTFALAGDLKRLDVESITGSIDVLLPESIGFTARLDSVTGRLISDYAHVSGRYEATHGDGKATLDFETVGGTVTINADNALTVPSAPQQSKVETQAQPTQSAPARSTDEPIPSSQRSF